jgi:hypothetical protein
MALHGGLYLAIIMDRHEGIQTPLTIALQRGFYLAIIMERYEGDQTPLIIALYGVLYVAIIMDRYNGPENYPNYSLAWRPLFSHYNAPL